ncbi:MAG: hypothetical protein JWO31_1634 [Phycisphaerales bacterium]|nr:hypothetical protein [Phycisphaerales bacterium]
MGDAATALTYADAALALGERDFSARAELAASHFVRDERDQGEPLLEELLAERPDDVRVSLLHVRSIAPEHRGPAGRELVRLADAHPGDIGALSARAQFELDAGEFAVALALLDGIPDSDREPDLLAIRAEAHRLLGQPVEAIRAARRCLDRARATAGSAVGPRCTRA